MAATNQDLRQLPGTVVCLRTCLVQRVIAAFSFGVETDAKVVIALGTLLLHLGTLLLHNDIRQTGYAI